jgi:hypothetical protein
LQAREEGATKVMVIMGLHSNGTPANIRLGFK